MSLSYWVRLLSLCFASFFLVHTAASLLVRLASSRAMRFAERLAPRTAARLMLSLRVLPFAVAVVSVLGLCAPSYLRFEQHALAEQVGPLCLALAALGVFICLAALDNGLGSITSSIEFARACCKGGHAVRLHGKPSRMLVIPGAHAFLAQSGVFRPRIVISQRLLAQLSPQELAAALSHERAHWISRDNLKRLLFAFLPDVLPLLPSFRAVERSWAKFAERAADDYVVASGEARAVSLASALVRLARTSTHGSSVELKSLATSLLGEKDGLAARVNRLLSAGTVTPKSKRPGVPAFLGATTFLALCSVSVLLWSAALPPVHNLLEFLIH